MNTEALKYLHELYQSHAFGSRDAFRAVNGKSAKTNMDVDKGRYYLKVAESIGLVERFDRYRYVLTAAGKGAANVAKP